MPKNVNAAKSAYLRLLAQAGSKKALAQSLGISRQAVDRWRVAPERWLARIGVIYHLTAREMRPDLFPPPPEP